MPPADASFTWPDAAVAFSILAVAAFLVTWVTTDLLRVGRRPYIGILILTVGGFGVWYVRWTGTALADGAAPRIAWGLAAGLIVAAIVAPLLRRLPRSERPTGARRAELIAWEDIVYGTAEALLLATYPVLIVWQAMAAEGVTDSFGGKLGAGCLAIVGSLIVTLVHHLGYEEFRSRQARPKLAGALLTCGLQAIAYLVTGSVVAPIVAHVALHLEMTLSGIELPPARSRAGSALP